MIIVKIAGIILVVFLVLFLLSLVIYFWNLDMKLAASILPLMTRYYDFAKARRDKKRKNGNKENRNKENRNN